MDWHIIHKEQTSSTQDDARALAVDGAPSGTVVVAREQTAGKGQWKRSWVSPAGGLYFSCVLRPAIATTLWPSRSSLCAEAVIQGIAKAYDVKPEFLCVKPPNDVVCDAGKISGILLEAFGGDTLVVGCGVNVTRPVEPIVTDGRNVPAYVQDYVPTADASSEGLDRLLRCILKELDQAFV